MTSDNSEKKTKNLNRTKIKMHLKQLKVVYELILVVVTYKRFKIKLPSTKNTRSTP